MYGLVGVTSDLRGTSSHLISLNDTITNLINSKGAHQNMLGFNAIELFVQIKKMEMQEPEDIHCHESFHLPHRQDLNIITLIKHPQQFRKTFQALAAQASQAFSHHDYEDSISLFLKCLDMLDIGKSVLVDLSPYWKPALLANAAAAYQCALKMQKCSKFCEKAQEEFGRLADVSEKELALKLSKVIVKLKFQHCAILSQLNQHQRALEVCKSTLPILEDHIKILHGFAQKQHETLELRSASEGVIFSRKVYSFGVEVLGRLLQSVRESPEGGGQKSSSLYFWERNPQQNEEQLKKIFIPSSNDNSKRSILGVNKQNHWVDQFNIGSIMRMGEVRVDQLEKNTPLEEYLFKDKLYELAIYCSLSFFTIATEIRFIDSEKEQEVEGAEKEESQKIEGRQIKRKYGYEEKSLLFKTSETYHLKSIDIVSKNIQATIPYLTHIIKSYDKHYVFKKKLEEIQANQDESLLQNSSIMVFSKKQDRAELSPKRNSPAKNILIENIYENGGHSRNLTHKESPQVFEDYGEGAEEMSNKSKQNDKNARNTMKLSYSSPRDQLKKRTKSAGKLRKPNLKTQAKEPQKIPAKPKKKQEKQKTERAEDHGFKKTRIKFNELEGEGQLHVKTKSSTHIKFVFKKKK